MERLIPLSTLEYFTQKNKMLGSVTPEDLVADPLARVFNYRVYVRAIPKTTFDEKGEPIEGEEKVLTAEYFIDNRCYDLTDKDKVVLNNFEVSVAGIDAAAAWLEAEYRVYERTALL